MAEKKKTNNTPKILLAILVVLIIAASFYFQNQKTPEPPVVEEPGIESGDLAAINFVLTYPNGTVVDTNDGELAKQANLLNYVTGPYRFVLGQDDKVKGFDDAIVGMKIGEKRKAIITPSEPVLTHTIRKSRQVSRNQPFLTFTPVKKDKFEERFGRAPVLNDVITTADVPWPVKVINITERHVVVESLAEEGKSYTLPGFEWESRLLIKTRNDMLFRHNPEDGLVVNNTEFGSAVVTISEGNMNLTYQVEEGQTITYGETGAAPYQFQVTKVTDEDFILTRINYLPQETLVLNVELLEWEQGVQKTKWIKKE